MCVSHAEAGAGTPGFGVAFTQMLEVLAIPGVCGGGGGGAKKFEPVLREGGGGHK